MSDVSKLGPSFEYLNYVSSLDKQKGAPLTKEERVQKVKSRIINELTLNAAVNKNKVHLEVNGRQVGKDISFYQSSIAKFFAKLFNTGQDIEINGEHYLVSKKSLEEHLKSIEEKSEKPETLKNYDEYFRTHKENIAKIIFKENEFKQWIEDNILIEDLNNQ